MSRKRAVRYPTTVVLAVLALACSENPSAPPQSGGGANPTNPPPPDPPLLPPTTKTLEFKALAAGGGHTCAITRVDETYCWGVNLTGQLGIADTTIQTTPVFVSNDFGSVTAGGAHTCAIDSRSELYCWGDNGRGQLGRGSSGIFSSTPAKVVQLPPVSKAVAYSQTTCAVTLTGEVYCWGDNIWGKLGLSFLWPNGTFESAVPVQITAQVEFTDVSVGAYHACALDTVGYAHCWGWGLQLGTGTVSNREVLSPLPVAGNNLFTTISSAAHTCGIATNGDGWCWGDDGRGEMGNGNWGESTDTPTKVVGALTFTGRMATGGGLSGLGGDPYTCATTAGMTAYCWGGNSEGQLGNGITTQGVTTEPRLVEGNHEFTRVVAGYRHACAITLTYEAYCWGRNTWGNLGDSTTTDSNVPVKVVNEVEA